jgi:microsomal dipeptidase-like Zn-dependent dipeptidase
MKYFSAFLLSLLVTFFPQLAIAETYFLSEAFTSGSNPNGPWEFGETNGIGGAFSRFSDHSIGQNGLNFWVGANPASGTPALYWNSTNSSIVVGRTGNYPAGAVGFHPGLNGRDTTFRFRAQINGQHLVHARLSSQDTATTKVTLLINGQAVIGPISVLPVFFPIVIEKFVSLNVGDTVDLSVDSDGSISNDSTGVDMWITTPRSIAWTPALRGFADTHVHQFANLAFGGTFIFGSPGGDQASVLSTDGDRLQHGLNHSLEALGAIMDGRYGLWLGNSGAPNYENWPSFRDTDHQKAYKDWLHRAVLGGMRLMVMLAVESPTLCRTGGGDVNTCVDEVTSIKRQIAAAYALQSEIDNDFGGPGKGWYRIVRSPAEARTTVAENKLAIVLGAETINSLGMIGTTTIQIIHEYRKNLGIRHIFPIHQADNNIGGAAFFESKVQRQGNVLTDPMPFTLESIIDSLGAARSPPVQARYVFVTETCNEFTKYKKCNSKGLTPLGREAIAELMRAGMLIDVDHMSRKSKAEVFDLARTATYPLFSSHAGFNELARGNPGTGQDHEGQLTEDDYHRLLNSGGMMGILITSGDVNQLHSSIRPPGKQGVPYRCGRSTESLAQAYLYAVDHGDGQGIGFATDLHTPSLLQLSPRFGSLRCNGGTNGNVPGWAPRLSYPFVSVATGQQFAPMTMLSRTIDYNEDGFATIGQYPDLIADLVAVGVSQDDLDSLFHSAEAYIISWENAERAAQSIPSRPQLEPSARRLPSDIPVSLQIDASDLYWERPITGGKVFVNNVERGVLGTPFTLLVPSKDEPCVCHTERYPRPHQVCEGGTKGPRGATVTVRQIPGFMDSDPLTIVFSPVNPPAGCGNPDL